MVVVAADDGMLLSKINQMRVRRLGGKGRGVGEKKTGCIGRKGNSVCGVKTKEKAKERKKKLKSSERADK